MEERRFDAAIKVLGGAVPRRTAFAIAVGLLAGSAQGGEAAVLTAQAKCRTENEKKTRGYIKQAAKKYNQNYKDMLCVAQCESALDNCAVNKQGKSYGLFQFIRSTWDSTPFDKKDIFDAKWSAFATGWMWKEGRQNEWTCWTQTCRRR